MSMDKLDLKQQYMDEVVIESFRLFQQYGQIFTGREMLTIPAVIDEFCHYVRELLEPRNLAELDGCRFWKEGECRCEGKLSSPCPSFGQNKDAYSRRLKGGGLKMEMDNAVESYLGLMKQIKQQVPNDEVAVKILIEIRKDYRMEQVRQEKQRHNGDRATENQLNLLRKLQIDITSYPNLSKHKASKLIDEAMNA